LDFPLLHGSFMMADGATKRRSYKGVMTRDVSCYPAYSGSGQTPSLSAPNPETDQ
jgi:hypothetical protein